ncbi:hypothetical protein MFIFM68171_02045 [Madurella fahalii]|uniref:Uncharacterized protein n=1 Tax=Madurella fahalii TaxID=1157608 RepID=A0ABQ0G2Q4_9PEZI
MASRSIEYIWKIARPKNEAVARAVMYAAYQTAIATDPNATRVLIRSYIHPTTWEAGKGFVKDDPHITISVKNPDMDKEKKHLTSHGYTPHLNSFNVIKVEPAPRILKDEGSTAWPAETATKPRETIGGPPGLLGPVEDFIAWPSEETGEDE